jgi:hypothetical protein
MPPSPKPTNFGAELEVPAPSGLAKDYPRMMKGSRTKTTPQCPHCGSAKAVPILWGMPTSVAGEAEERGEIVLGGCCVTGDDPKWYCRDCGWAWNARRGEQWEKR